MSKAYAYNLDIRSGCSSDKVVQGKDKRQGGIVRIEFYISSIKHRLT